MSAPPFMKLYVADYLGDTHHLCALEHGAYLLLLMSMWRAGGRLPRDEAKLAKIARCTPEEWASVRDAVLPFFTQRGGLIRHHRLSIELAKYEDAVDQASRAGKASGLKRANKNSGVSPPIRSHSVEPETNQPEAEAELERERRVDNPLPSSPPSVVEPIGGVGSDDWPSGDLVKALVEATESPKLDPSKSPGLITTAGRLAAWRREGASWTHDVLPVVRGLCAGHRGPVTTWKFFDAAIGRSIADNRQALEIPSADPTQRSQAPSIGDRIAAEHAEARNRAFRMLENGNSR